MERITPQILKAEFPAAQVASDKKSASTARAENTIEGHCPICGEQMRPLHANGHDVLGCMEHNVIMPVRT